MGHDVEVVAVGGNVEVEVGIPVIGEEVGNDVGVEAVGENVAVEVIGGLRGASNVRSSKYCLQAIT